MCMWRHVPMYYVCVLCTVQCIIPYASPVRNIVSVIAVVQRLTVITLGDKVIW